MNPLEQLKENIKRMGKGQVPVQTFWAKVESVDWANKTADVKDLSADLEVFDVLLGLGNDFMKPAVGSNCLCGIINNQDASAFIIYTESVEERWISGNANGGLTITPILQQELAKLTARVDGIINAINGGVPVAQDGGTALLTSIKTALATLVNKENFNNIENTKVKHG